MRIKNKKMRKITKISAIVLVVLGIYLLGISYGDLLSRNTNKDTPADSSELDVKSNDSTSTLDEVTEGETEPSELPAKKEPEKATTKNSSDSTFIIDETIEKPSISRAEQSSDTSIKIVALFYEHTTGKCDISLTKNSLSVNSSASIVTGPSYYLCSFTIPRSEIPESGLWSLVVTHIINNGGNSSEPVQVEIK